MSTLHYEFLVSGLPVPYRTGRRRNGATYVTAPVRAWQRSVALQATRYRPAAPLDCPLCVELAFALPMPASWPTAKRWRMHEKPCAVKPDCDDLEKPVIDALNQSGWFADDSRIVLSTTRKVYTTGLPGVAVVIEAVKGLSNETHSSSDADSATRRRPRFGDSAGVGDPPGDVAAPGDWACKHNGGLERYYWTNGELASERCRLCGKRVVYTPAAAGGEA